MFKALWDRLFYALMAGAFGALLGLALWYFFDAGFSRRIGAPEVHLGLASWVKYSAAIFALLGFFFKTGAADALGESMQQVHRHESRSNTLFGLPMGLVAAVTAAAYFWWEHH